MEIRDAVLKGLLRVDGEVEEVEGRRRRGMEDAEEVMEVEEPRCRRRYSLFLVDSWPSLAVLVAVPLVFIVVHLNISLASLRIVRALLLLSFDVVLQLYRTIRTTRKEITDKMKRTR